MSNKEKLIDKSLQYPLSIANILLSDINSNWLNYLEPNEFWELVRLKVLAKVFKSEILNDFVITYLNLRVSVKGRGREDIIKINKQSSQKILQSFFEKRKTFKEYDMSE